VAALPLRRREDGTLEVLLVTSRDTGRWVLPKGWPMNGKPPWRAAEIEAEEEAGVTGRVARDDLGRYHYGKRLDGERVIDCRVKVFPLLVERERERWKEARERQRRWFSLAEAAEAVDEPELKELLLKLDRKRGKSKVVRELLKAG
jgi:8-oxo-dGTP pyrophosphatase MutT (NUDIX family)